MDSFSERTLKSYIIQYADNYTPAHFKILPKVHIQVPLGW